MIDFGEELDPAVMEGDEGNSQKAFAFNIINTQQYFLQGSPE